MKKPVLGFLPSVLSSHVLQKSDLAASLASSFPVSSLASKAAFHPSCPYVTLLAKSHQSSLSLPSEHCYLHQSSDLWHNFVLGISGKPDRQLLWLGQLGFLLQPLNWSHVSLSSFTEPTPGLLEDDPVPVTWNLSFHTQGHLSVSPILAEIPESWLSVVVIFTLLLQLTSQLGLNPFSELLAPLN